MTGWSTRPREVPVDLFRRAFRLLPRENLKTGNWKPESLATGNWRLETDFSLSV
jgi:hypothetical protein